MNFIKKILGIQELINEQIKTNKLLEDIHKESKRNADLQKSYNKAYHIE